MKIPFLPKTTTPTVPPPPPSPIFPTPHLPPALQSSSTAKLFITGATVGPIVDSLHNQCLLEYDRAPISIPMPQLPQLQSALSFPSLPSSLSSSSPSVIDSTIMTTTTTITAEVPSYLFCSSWYIPLLLGVAYVVLGDILPKIISYFIESISSSETDSDPTARASRTKYQNKKEELSSITTSSSTNTEVETEELRKKALLAVSSTALIIKLSDYLQTHPSFSSFIEGMITQTIGSSNTNFDIKTINLSIMIVASILQWAALDGTLTSLITASVVSIGGPLSELPFVANGFWHYIPSAADYVPLADGVGFGRFLERFDLDFLRGYKDLTLSSITGPCYFAVTMDAIALGRWFNNSGGSDANVEQ